MDDPAVEGKIIVSVPFTLPVEEGAVLEEEAGARVSPRGMTDVEYWRWAQCLAIPRADVLKFSPKPYKWIRFVTGAILGAEGVLCDSDDDINAPEIDYNRSLLPGDSSLFFHVTPAERARIFPLDPRLAHAYSATGTTDSTRYHDFRERIVHRDGHCVATDAEEVFCDAAHLIGHTQGNKYIEAFTQGRSHEPPGPDGRSSDCIIDIDDPRNGLLVHSSINRLLETRNVAFLVTPNFAMSSSDVDPTLQADDDQWTLRDFSAALHPDLQVSVRRVDVSHNQHLRVSVDQAGRSAWPPRIIFDAVYTSAIWKRYCHADYAAVVSMHWQDHFCPGGVRPMPADGGMVEIRRKNAQGSAHEAESKQKRDERSAK